MDLPLEPLERNAALSIYTLMLAWRELLDSVPLEQ